MKKSIKRAIIFATAVLSIIIIACNSRVNNISACGEEYEVAMIEQTIRNNIGWAANKDFDLLRSTILLDSTYLVVNPTDRIEIGEDDFRQTEEFFRNPEFKAVGFEISDLRINIAGGGQVAWFYCLLNDWNTWKGSPANWENVRWTGVLEKTDGIWRIRQMHFSYPK